MRATGLITLVLIAASAVVAHATPAQELQRGRDSFRARDWGSAIPVLNSLIYPEVQFAREEDVVETLILLGTAFFEIGNIDRARQELKRAIELDPDRSITTLTFSAGAVRLFDQLKAEHQEQIERDAEKKRIAEQAEAIALWRKSLVVYEARPYYLNFMPFGLAQYTQNRTRAGALFTLGQGVTFVASIGIYGYLVGTYGFDNSEVPPINGPRVRLLQQLEIGSGIAFFGLYALGVFDAIRHHKPRQQVEGDDSLIPKSLLDPTPKKAAPPKKTATSFRDRLQISPLITPGGVGIGIGWEN